MEWRVVFSEGAENDFSSLDTAIQSRVIKKLEWFEKNFSATAPLALSADWAGLYKIRVGEYRVIYSIMEKRKMLMIEAIDHRSRIYKRKRQ